jgi:hypothetical protein
MNVGLGERGIDDTHLLIDSSWSCR